jgi:hypothetical protein
MARAASPPRGSDDPPRLWTAAEANRRLADLEQLLPRLRAWAVRLGEVHSEVHRLGEFWGKEIDAPDHIDHERKIQLDSEWTHLTRRLEEAVDSLARDGIQVKDLETGLVDFFGKVDGEVVFLCWLRGEAEVAHYHTLAGGYRSRRPLEPSSRAAAPTGSGETN